MKFLCNQKGMRTIQYFGGKTKVAKQIVEYLESVRKEQQTYIEPFIGGGIICSKMSGNRIASDYNEYLIEMYNAVQTGYELPEEITKEQYDYIRNNKDENKALTGFVGFGCSFAGKWFGGYARQKGYNFASGSKRSLLKKMKTMQDVKFEYKNYKEWMDIKGALIYCDPPYSETTQPYGTGDFNTEEFWEDMRVLSKNNNVYISEYSAPKDFECVLEIPTKTIIRDSNDKVSYRVEKLFTYKK